MCQLTCCQCGAGVLRPRMQTWDTVCQVCMLSEQQFFLFRMCRISSASSTAQFLLSFEVLGLIMWPRLQASTSHYSFLTLTVCAWSAWIPAVPVNALYCSDRVKSGQAVQDLWNVPIALLLKFYISGLAFTCGCTFQYRSIETSDFVEEYSWISLYNLQYTLAHPQWHWAAL